MPKPTHHVLTADQLMDGAQPDTRPLTTDLSVDAEPARDDVANAMQVLVLGVTPSLTDPDSYVVSRKDLDAVYARLQSALRKMPVTK